VVKRHERLRVWQGDIDATMTPPGAQYGAAQGKAEKENQLRYAVFATLCNA
jgi:hypothetical protein